MILRSFRFGSSSSGSWPPGRRPAAAVALIATAPSGAASGSAYCVGSSSVVHGDGGCLQSSYVGECLEQADGPAGVAAAFGGHGDGAVRGGDHPRRHPARAELPPAAELAGVRRGLRGPGGAPAVPARHGGGRRHRVGGADRRRDGLPADLASGFLRAVLGRAGFRSGPDAHGRRHRQGGAAQRLAHHPSRHHGLRHPAVGGPGSDHRQRRPQPPCLRRRGRGARQARRAGPGRTRRTAASPRNGCGSHGNCTTPSGTMSP